VNVNFLHDIIHALQNTIDWCINSALDQRGYVLEVNAGLGYQIQWNNAMQRPRSSRSFKVTDFGINRKLMYNFLLVINTNLPPTLHRFQVLIIGHCSASERGIPTLTLSLGWSPANRHKWSQKTIFFGLHFRCRKYWCIFNHFYVICPESYRIRWNYAAVIGLAPFKNQGHPRSPFGRPTNRKLICDFLLVINTNLAPVLQCFRDTAFNRSRSSTSLC